MVVIFLLLVSFGHVATQSDCPSPCHDVPPDNSGLPCDYYTFLGQCDDDIMKNSEGQYAFCFCSCGRCTPGAFVPPNPTSVDIFQVSGNAAVISGEAFSTAEVTNNITSAIATARATLDQARIDANDDSKEEAIIQAATATTESVSTAIATAFAATSIRAATSGENSRAFGQASARAEAIANATASAYASALAEAGDETVFLESETFATDIKTALVNSYSELEITGDSQASVVNEAVGKAVAEVVATATANAFARYAGGESQAIALAVSQATLSDDIGCPAACNNDPPTNDFTCDQQKEWGKCNDAFMSGFCECVCNTCSVGAEASTSTQIDLQTQDDQEVTVSVDSGATAEGIAGADASAQAIVTAAASGNAQAIVSAVSEAFASGSPAEAIADAIAQAVGQGNGETMATSVAEAFALAEQGGNAAAVAESIVYAFTRGKQNVAQAYGEALTTAIATGGCEAVGTALTEAEAQAIGRGAGDAFAEAASQVEAVNDCLYGSGSEEPVFVSGEASAEAIMANVRNAITDALLLKDTTAAADGIVTAIRDQQNSDPVIRATSFSLGRGTSCDTVVNALKQAISVVGDDPLFKEVFDKTSRLRRCLRQGLASCGRSVQERCCSTPLGGCDCIGGNCRRVGDFEQSIPAFDHYIYTTVSNGRQCFCP